MIALTYFLALLVKKQSLKIKKGAGSAP